MPRGIGEHYVHLEAALRHAHRAVEVDPLQGEAYLMLAQLAFLESSSVPSKSAYVEQAFRVRPHHGTVLFEIGNEMTLAGHPDRALKYLKRSFARGPEHQKRLIQTLAGNVPVELFLREFRPDADAMQIMVGHYRRAELKAELDSVLAAHATACEAKAVNLTGAGRGEILVSCGIFSSGTPEYSEATRLPAERRGRECHQFRHPPGTWASPPCS